MFSVLANFSQDVFVVRVAAQLVISCYRARTKVSHHQEFIGVGGEELCPLGLDHRSTQQNPATRKAGRISDPSPPLAAAESPNDGDFPDELPFRSRCSSISIRGEGCGSSFEEGEAVGYRFHFQRRAPPLSCPGKARAAHHPSAALGRALR